MNRNQPTSSVKAPAKKCESRRIYIKRRFTKAPTNQNPPGYDWATQGFDFLIESGKKLKKLVCLKKPLN